MIIPGFPMPLAMGGGGPPELVGAATATTPSSASTLDCDVPIGTTNGDLMLAVIVLAAGTRDPDIPTGWTQEYESVGEGNPAYAIYSRVASFEPSAYTFTWTSNTNTSIAILSYRNLTAFGETGGAARDISNSIAAPSATAVDGGVVVGFYAHNTATAVNTDPSGMTQIVPITPDQPKIVLYHILPSVAGATGSKSVQFNTSSGISGILFTAVP